MGCGHCTDLGGELPPPPNQKLDCKDKQNCSTLRCLCFEISVLSTGLPLVIYTCNLTAKIRIASTLNAQSKRVEQVTYSH